MTDADKNKRDAMLLLDNMDDYGASEKQLLAELMFNFGYSDDEAGAVYREWLRVQA